MKIKNKVSFDERCLISCDLDGTLLNSKSEISQYSKKVIKKLTDMGHIFCINTARPFNACEKYYKELGLNTPIVTHNGALMFNPYRSDFPSTNWCISREIIKELIGDKNIRKYACNAIIDAEQRTYVYVKNDWTEKQWHKVINDFGIYTTENIVKLNGTLKGFKDTAYCVLFVPKQEKDLMDLTNAIKTKVPTLLTKLWRVEGMGVVVEVCSPNCSKAIALRDLATYYGIPDWRTVAFGDGLDDAEMLKYAICGYAMKNGKNEAQMNAAYITKWTNDEDGVAKTLEALLRFTAKLQK